MTELDPARVKELIANWDSELWVIAPELAAGWLASQKHITALETASRALVAKLNACPDFWNYRDELDALIAVLKSSEREG